MGSACATMTHAGCAVEIAYASTRPIGPRPNVALAVGIVMHEAIWNHITLCVKLCRGIVAVTVYIAFHAGPVSVGSHPVYSFNLVVRGSVVVLFRRESYRCLASVLSILVCHLVLWLLWVVART